MKFRQIIEYNMRKNFCKNSYTRCGGKTVPGPFAKKSKLSIFLDRQTKVLYSLLLLYAKLRTIATKCGGQTKLF